MEETAAQNASTSNAKLVYILYLAGLVVGITALVGVVMAYMNRDEGPDWLKSHYEFQIGTFWKGLVFLILGGLLSAVLIGWIVILFWLVWLIVRCVKGMKLLDQQQSQPNPKAWGF